MRRRSPRRSACTYDILPIERRRHRPRSGVGAAVRRPAARHHRGEPAVARARHHPDGDLQQARPDGGDDRQQVGNVGRLRHALRRHERRLQSDQGPLQDRGLSARASAQPVEAGLGSRSRRAGHSREHHHARPDRPSSRQIRRIRTRCRPTTCSTPSCAVWSSARSRLRRSSPRVRPRGGDRRSTACSISPSTSGVRPRRA